MLYELDARSSLTSPTGQCHTSPPLITHTFHSIVPNSEHSRHDWYGGLVIDMLLLLAPVSPGRYHLHCSATARFIARFGPGSAVEEVYRPTVP